MKRIMPLTMQFIFLDLPESKQRLKTMYNRIFTIARQNLIAKRQSDTLKKEEKN